ncbi:MAG: RnfABCDGE type electron transport complex subunit D, partial [Endomicrobiia bacterium]|nr:RnfABCDGE type electron transport complex subunit D [Endomicrobiia bacterium]
MKPARIFVDMLYRNSPKRLAPVINALDEFFFGTPSRTSGPPHILDNLGVKRYISTVIVALIPAAAAAVYFFGLRAVWIILVSYVFGGAVEAAFAVV